jgi:hypothetical protein
MIRPRRENGMSIEMSPGEVFDRYTILRMKSIHATKDVSMQKEKEKFADEVRLILEYHPVVKDVMNRFALVGLLLEIMEANAKIWVLESAIREPVNGELADDEVGRRAIQIREHNKKRVIAKAAVDTMLGATPDFKVDHASE